ERKVEKGKILAQTCFGLIQRLSRKSRKDCLPWWRSEQRGQSPQPSPITLAEEHLNSYQRALSGLPGLREMWNAETGRPAFAAFVRTLPKRFEQESDALAEAQLEKRFREQADKWERETQHLSSPTQRIMHPSYQAILGMGQEHK